MRKRANIYPDYALIDPKAEIYTNINDYECPYNGFYNAIDDGIQELVYMLRSNGVNTTCSCIHEKYIQFEAAESGMAEHVYTLLYNHGFKDFQIKFSIEVNKDYPRRFGAIKFDCMK